MPAAWYVGVMLIILLTTEKPLLVEIVDLENDPVECGRRSGSFHLALPQINAGGAVMLKAA